MAIIATQRVPTSNGIRMEADKLHSMWVSVMTTFASIRVGRVIHKRLTTSLMAATFRWLDTVPTSRVITRYGCLTNIRLLHLTYS
jgi:hypothetical protein